VIYPLTVWEIAQAQKLNASLKKLIGQSSTQLVENTKYYARMEKWSSLPLLNTVQIVATLTIYGTRCIVLERYEKYYP
jgi:hypothetical protein